MFVFETIKKLVNESPVKAAIYIMDEAASANTVKAAITYGIERGYTEATERIATCQACKVYLESDSGNHLFHFVNFVEAVQFIEYQISVTVYESPDNTTVIRGKDVWQIKSNGIETNYVVEVQ